MPILLIKKMLSSLDPGNDIYNSFNYYQKKSELKHKKFNKKLLLPHLRYNNNEKIISNILKIDKIKNSKIKNTSRNYLVNKLPVSSSFNEEKKTNNIDFKKIYTNRNIISSSSCENIFNKNLSILNSNNKLEFSNILNKHKLNIKKLNSLQGFNKLSKESNPKQQKCNYIFLEYKGKINNNEYKKKSYIQINPHKLIEQLRTLSMPFDVYGIKIFSVIDKYINKYSYLNNHREDYIKYINRQKISNENNAKLQEIDDKFLLPDKYNKYNYFIKKIFFNDIMDKVMKKMVEIRDKHNKIISKEEIKMEYNKQLNNLELFLDYKIKNKNRDKSIVQELNIIQNNANKNLKENNCISKKDFFQKNLNLISIRVDQKDRYLLYQQHFIENNNNINNNKNLYKLNNSVSCGNIKGLKNKKKNCFVLGPITDRKNWANSQIEEYLFKSKMDKVIFTKDNTNKFNYSKNYENSFDFVPQLNIVDFDDIYKEIQLLSQGKAKNNDKNQDIINLIISENDTFKKLKFDHLLSKKFIELIRNEKSKISTELDSKKDLDIQELINKQIKKNEILNIIEEENKRNYYNIMEGNKLSNVRKKLLGVKNKKYRNRSADMVNNKYMINEFAFKSDNIIGSHNISIISNNSDINEKRNYITESDNNSRKLYIKNLKLNKREMSSSISTTINNILEIKNKNISSDYQSEDYSKLIYDTINNISERTNSSIKIKNNDITKNDENKKKFFNKVTNSNRLNILFIGKSKKLNNKEEEKNLIIHKNKKIKNKSLDNKNNDYISKKKVINFINLKNDHYKKDYNENYFRKKIITKNNKKINKIRYENKIIQTNINNINSNSMKLNNMKDKNNKSFKKVFSLSSQGIQNNSISVSITKDNINDKNNTFYCNNKHINDSKTKIKKSKSFSNLDINKMFKIFNDKEEKDKNVIKANKRNKKKSKKLKKQLLLEKLFKMNSNIFEPKFGLFKTVSNFKNFFNNNKESNDTDSSLSFPKIFKKDDKNKTKVKKSRKSEQYFKDLINRDFVDGIDILDEKMKLLKKRNKENSEKNKYNWEKKFESFKNYVKKNKDITFKEFIEKSEKEKEIEYLNFDLKLSNVNRINNFKRYIRNYKKRMKNLCNENKYKIVFMHPCTFDNGKYFQ